jgi:hypothetical protein
MLVGERLSKGTTTAKWSAPESETRHHRKRYGGAASTLVRRI